MIGSHPPPHAGCPRGGPGPLPRSDTAMGAIMPGKAKPYRTSGGGAALALPPISSNLLPILCRPPPRERENSNHQDSGPSNRIMLQCNQRLVCLLKWKGLYMRADGNGGRFGKKLAAILPGIVGDTADYSLAVDH